MRTALLKLTADLPVGILTRKRDGKQGAVVDVNLVRYPFAIVFVVALLDDCVRLLLLAARRPHLNLGAITGIEGGGWLHTVGEAGLLVRGRFVFRLGHRVSIGC